MATDKVAINFPAPNFVNGEMVTSGKLGQVSSYFAAAGDALLGVMGNVYLRNMPNLAAAIGDITKLAPGSNPLSAASPGFFNPQNPYINKLPVILTQASMSNSYTATIINGGKLLAKHLVSDSSGSGQTIINVTLVAVDSNKNVVRAYECAYYNGDGGHNIGDDIASITAVGGSQETNLSQDASNNNLSFYLLCANESMVDSLALATANIGSMSYASSINGFISGPTDSITYSASPRNLTEEISIIENKTFCVYWRIQLSNHAGTGQTFTVDSTPVETGEAVRSTTCRKWIGTAKWYSASSPNPTLAGTYAAMAGVTFANYTTQLSSDAFAMGSAVRSAEILTPNPMRAAVYYNGTPVLRTDGCRVTAYFKPSDMSLSIPVDDIFWVSNTTNDFLTVYLPVFIPYRLLRSLDLANRAMIDMWYGFFKNVVGTQYTSASLPPTIASRLTRLEANQQTLDTAITALTSSANPTPWISL